jgi:hypothetical protein
MIRIFIGLLLLAWYALNVIRLGLILLAGHFPGGITAAWNVMHGYDPARMPDDHDRLSIVLTALAIWTVVFALPGTLLVFFGWRARRRKAAPAGPAG